MLKIDLSRDALLTEQAQKLLQDYYMLPDERSPQEAFARAASGYGSRPELAQNIYDYASKGWFMFASPILSNAPGARLARKTGLPISCFLSYVPDTIDGLIAHQSELSWLSVKGGGVGGHWSSVRDVDFKSPGPIPFIHTVDAAMTAFKQGKTRKGAYAAYLDVSHPAIAEFLNIRVPTGGDINRKCFNIHNAVNISDAFMDAVYRNSDWPLIDPATKQCKEVVSARELWQRILEVRYRTGEPYLNFIDTANRKLNPFQREKGLTVKGSNLCNEIHLVTDEQRTAVCCLSSVNLEKFDEWKDTDMLGDLVEYLDDVLEYFIQNCPPEMTKAKFSAERERSIGIGAMGWHGYLQQKGIAFESALAVARTHSIFSLMKDKATARSQALAKTRGEPEDIVGSGMRNAHLFAIAPNANSSIICNCSPSIEPVKDNAYAHRTRIGTHLVKNKYLEVLLDKKGKNTDAIWESIILNEGSVQHLPFLSEFEKDVFKTFKEIDQHWVIEQAGVRQDYICQGQSVNLSFPAGAARSYFNSVHLKAHRSGLKGLYYVRTSSGAKTDQVSKQLERTALSSILNNEECLSCHG